LFGVTDAELADGTPVRGVLYLYMMGNGAAGTYPAHNTRIDVLVRYTGKPSAVTPAHLEGMTTGELLRDLYDGVYSWPDPITGEVVPTGIRYHEPDLLLMTDPVLARITEPVDDVRDWAEKYIYAPTGWIPALDNDGRISPRSQVPPDSFADLLDVRNAITAPEPDWSAGERTVNVVTFGYQRWYPADPEDVDAVDRLAVREVTHEYRDEASVDLRGLAHVSYDGLAFGAPGNEYGDPILNVTREYGYGHALNRRTYVLHRYTNGAAIIEVPVMRRHCATLRAGDWVVADLSWFPDYLTRRRGLVTGGQILAVRDLDCAWRVLLIEEAFPLAEGS
jgi:hypothetical protein